MKEFVDEAAGESFDGGKLLRAERPEAGLNAAKLGLANLFCLALEGDDRGSDVDGAAALMEALDFGGDEGFGVSSLRAALGHVRSGDRLQIVDVVDEDAVDLVHRRIDVARHGDVDEEHGPVAAAMHEGLSVLAAEDGMRRAGGADDDVGFGGCFVELIEGDDPAVEGLGKLAGALLRAVGDEDGACSLLHEMAGCEFAHFSCADEEDGAAVERAEDFAGQFDGDRGDGDGVGADGGFGADALGCGEGGLEEMFELAGDGASGAGDGKSVFDLAENLRFADDHGVEAGGDAEEMANGLLIAVLVDVRRENCG